MFALMQLFVALVSNRFKSPRRLEIENLYLRHQLNIALRQTRHRLRLKGADRALLVWMTWLWPSMLSLSRVVQPDTILRWHRGGFRAYWRWKSRRRSGRPGIARELREVIRQMSRQNPLWGHRASTVSCSSLASRSPSQRSNPAPRATVTKLADVSAQSCACHRGD